MPANPVAVMLALMMFGGALALTFAGLMMGKLEATKAGVGLFVLGFVAVGLEPVVTGLAYYLVVVVLVAAAILLVDHYSVTR